MIFLLACESNQPIQGGTCAPGQSSCPCLPSDTCSTVDGTRLICDRGFCVPESCTAGSEDCRCYANGSCDPLDGVPMTCDGNVCKKTIAPGAGELNGPCNEDGTCGEFEGEALICRNGACELVRCPSGNLGCPCELYGRCESEPDAIVVCNDGRCVPPDCSSGSLGCPCESEDDCREGAECLSGVCRPGGVVVSVEGEGVRGCDVVLGLPELAGARADFDAAILGEGMQRGQRFALAFIAREDEDMQGEVVIVHRVASWFGEGVMGWSEALTVENTVCYDRAGVPLESVEVSVR